MDVIYTLGSATAQEVLAQLPDPPSCSSVRALLKILEDKGHLRHQQRALTYVYLPTTPRDQARVSALKRVVETFFGGSAAGAVAALLDASKDDLSQEDLAQLALAIQRTRKQGR